MRLSKRLKHVAEHVVHAGMVADVGCDHGFTSIYLVQTGRAERALAMDINKEPLLRAKEHMKQYQMEEKIELRQSDGLSGLKEGEADTLLISGLGGLLMCRILKEGKEKLNGMERLVLSPQSDIPQVRRLLHELCFQIEGEEMVCDQKKYYVILCAVPGEEHYETEEDYLYGRELIQKRDPVFIEFLQKKYGELSKVIGSMEKSSLSGRGELQLVEQKRKREQIVQILHRMDK